ncbi:RNA polymerase sigma factor [Saccharospirillum salsuginis]|uniref:RNA polymerase sigma factor n=1 Tax=Saccharospirillum salsuginis TaxID=418750 RepID=UPI001E5164AC|nr:sigma-70 family RNA polymerase sigma factor [Saccharospirillum salsuginis]
MAEQRRFFAREVERLTDRLYGTALRLTRDPDEAQDVVAEAVAKAWSRLDELRDRAQFEGWLFRILNNTFISLLRRRRCRQDRETGLETEGEEQPVTGFSLFEQLHQPFLLWWGTPQDQVLDSLLLDDIERALDDLPEPYRLVVVLVEVQGYSYREVSEMLALPLGTIRSRLSRARSQLQAALWECAQDAGLVYGPCPTNHGGGE